MSNESKQLKPAEWPCLDCEDELFPNGDYYMVIDELWRKCVPDGKGFLCIPCLAKRAGRLLTLADFPMDIPLNIEQIDTLPLRIIKANGSRSEVKEPTDA
jgi:hypothetical protein